MKTHFSILGSLLVICITSGSVKEMPPDDSPDLQEMIEEFADPAAKYHPETWFHFNGNNISKAGITLDLEAIKYAGIQGIHLFSKNGRPYPGVEQIKVLSPEWEDMVRHTADECRRLGLKFTMQNCPGWSMTGGPWVPVEEAQRELVASVYQLNGDRTFAETLELDSVYHTVDYDYKDVQVLAFPTPQGEKTPVLIPTEIETNNQSVPWAELFIPESKLDLTEKSLPEHILAYSLAGIAKVDDQNTWVKVKFDQKVTLRSIELPPLRNMIMDRQYPLVDVLLKIQAVVNGRLTDVASTQLPSGNWSDRQLHLTLAVPETTSDEFRITFVGEHSLVPEFMYLSARPSLHNYEAKAGKTLRSLEREVEQAYSKNGFIDPQKIINLTDQMDLSGKLTWQVPAGDWTVVRYGHINMRRTNKPAMPESTGWESSKLDKVAIENHLRNGMIGKMIKDGGPIGDGKLAGLLIDSWESFVPTWTMHAEDMFKEFEQRRGYSMKSYLPALDGYIVQGPEVSAKFLRDWRQTLDEVYIDHFFSHFATVAHDMGAAVYTEGAGGEVLPIDPMRYYGVSDYPMTEFWYPKAPSAQNEYGKPIFSAASATHLYNKPLLAAEACTQLEVGWNEHPFTVKYLIDYNFTKGVNHLVFHTFSHTPQPEVYPGSSFAGRIGFPFVRQQTWWRHMPAFIDYLARCQYLLQQGEYAADVLWYYGDHYERPPFDLDDFPVGYRFDYLNAEILHEKLTVQDGKIRVKDAGDYRLILLRNSEEMVLSTVQKLKELVLVGAVIVGDKPLDSPSLMDDENDLTKLRSIADELWGNSPNGVKKTGQGKVYWGKTLDEVLKAESIPPDVIVPEGLPITWIHRRTADADIYFVSSTSDQSLDASLSFRVNNAYPQFWDPFTGTQRDAVVWSKEKDRIDVAVSFAPSGSAILVFPRGKRQPLCSKVEWNGQTLLSAARGWSRSHDETGLPSVRFDGKQLLATRSGNYLLTRRGKTSSVAVVVNKTSLQNDWTAAFESGWDTPESIPLAELASLTEHPNEAVRHYSGTVTYSKSIDIEAPNATTILDLGEVADIAEVWINGKKAGTRWAPPYTFNLSGQLKAGRNELTVKVTNTWRNQLIYDQTRPNDQKKTWTTNPPAEDETDLEASGLIGPVVLRETVQ